MARARRSVWVRLLLGSCAMLSTLVAVCVVRAVLVSSRQVEVEAAPAIAVDAQAVARRLAESLALATISDPGQFSPAAFNQLHEHLARSFPRTHATLERERVGEYSLLYTWSGTDADRAPLLLLAHLDVVPVDAGSSADWTYPAFDGVVADGYVWGRGALDDKSSVLGLLEAVEHLLAAGHRPRRTIHLAFGHDEEIGGSGGAARIAALLAERGVAPWMVLDEGGASLEGMVPGIERPIAFVGIAEKGYLSVELTAVSEGGHSSRPPHQTAIGVLASAINRLEEHPLPARLGQVTAATMDHVAPELTLSSRTVLANRWLFGPAIEYALASMPDSAPMVRTTTAVTMVQGGTKDNVLPIRATAIVNFRLAPEDTPDDVLEHVRRVIDDDRVDAATIEEPRAAGAVSGIDNAAWLTLARTIRELDPDTVVAPYLVIGGTDARHYQGLCDAVYRFKPGRVDSSTLARVHGTDERIAIEDHVDTVKFYVRLIENASAPPSEDPG